MVSPYLEASHFLLKSRSTVRELYWLLHLFQNGVQICSARSARVQLFGGIPCGSARVCAARFAAGWRGLQAGAQLTWAQRVLHVGGMPLHFPLQQVASMRGLSFDSDCERGTCGLNPSQRLLSARYAAPMAPRASVRSRFSPQRS